MSDYAVVLEKTAWRGTENEDAEQDYVQFIYPAAKALVHQLSLVFHCTVKKHFGGLHQEFKEHQGTSRIILLDISLNKGTETHFHASKVVNLNLLSKGHHILPFKTST